MLKLVVLMRIRHSRVGKKSPIKLDESPWDYETMHICHETPKLSASLKLSQNPKS